MKTTKITSSFLSKSLLLLSFSAISATSFSQTNTFPTSGNVGIGTSGTPTTKLQVNGSARIDSMLVVKDSIIVNKTAHLKSNLKVAGEAVFKDNVIIRQDLKVVGQSNLVGDVVIKEGDLKIKSLADSTLPDDGILLINANGKVKNGGDLKSLVYLPLAEQTPACLSDLNGGTIYSAPYWQAAGMPNPMMYLINTPCSPDPRLGVGIKPQAKLHIKLSNNNSINPILVQDANGFKLLQLQSNGTILGRKIRLDMQNWADFVFDPNYELMDLDSLALYISKNKHLPDIPSEENVINQGIDLGEMHRLLLKKVEELTLYLLQEKKKNDELEERLKRIEEQLAK